jgi:hypothetical protein
MPEPEKIFPEFGVTTDVKTVPWADAVVWAERLPDGRRAYEWLTKEHIRSMSWDKGSVSIIVATDSFLGKASLAFVIRAPFIAIGKNVSIV